MDMIQKLTKMKLAMDKANIPEAGRIISIHPDTYANHKEDIDYIINLYNLELVKDVQYI